MPLIRRVVCETDRYFELVLQPVEIELSISDVHQLFAPTRKFCYNATGLQMNTFAAVVLTVILSEFSVAVPLSNQCLLMTCSNPMSHLLLTRLLTSQTHYHATYRSTHSADSK